MPGVAAGSTFLIKPHSCDRAPRVWMVQLDVVVAVEMSGSRPLSGEAIDKPEVVKRRTSKEAGKAG